MTRVIHTGDTHLGYRQYHSPARRQDFAAAFERVVADAVADDVDAVVHAGDLFHDRRPDLPDLLATISVLRDLDDAGIPFLAVVGNHESTRGVTAGGPRRDAQWLDLFETLGLAERLDASGTRIGDVAFYGLDHVPPSKRDALDYEFDPPDADHAALVSHGQFEPLAARGSWDVETVLAESNVAFDAVLLGDDHAADTAEVDGTWVTYCGSTERTSASERPERGYNVVTFGDAVQVSRRGIETREFVFVDLELHEGEGTGRVLERLRQEDLEDAVVVVTLEGDGDPVTQADVEAFGDEQGALVTRVNDRRDLAEPEAATEVSFADPDAAVRRRVREMGLSEAARRVDRAVRDGGVADSNLRGRVEETVRDLLDDDPDAFERVPDDDEAAGDDEAGEPAGDGDSDEPAGEGSADDEPTDDAAATAVPATDGDGTAGTADGDEAAGTAAAEQTGAADDRPADPADEGSSADDGAEDQATMEEYL